MSNYPVQQSSALQGARSREDFDEILRGEVSPDTSMLHGIRRRIAEIESNVRDIHGIADRACGAPAPNVGDAKGAPRAVPNGMLEEIENALDNLMALSGGAVNRLGRIA